MLRDFGTPGRQRAIEADRSGVLYADEEALQTMNHARRALRQIAGPLNVPRLPQEWEPVVASRPVPPHQAANSQARFADGMCAVAWDFEVGLRIPGRTSSPERDPTGREAEGDHHYARDSLTCTWRGDRGEAESSSTGSTRSCLSTTPCDSCRSSSVRTPTTGTSTLRCPSCHRSRNSPDRRGAMPRCCGSSRPPGRRCGNCSAILAPVAGTRRSSGTPEQQIADEILRWIDVGVARPSGLHTSDRRRGCPRGSRTSSISCVPVLQERDSSAAPTRA